MNQYDINETKAINTKVVPSYNNKIYRRYACVVDEYMQLNTLSNM